MKNPEHVSNVRPAVKRWLGGLVAVAAVAAVLTAAERPADACGGGDSKEIFPTELVLLGATVVVLDTSFAIHDLTVDDSSRGYATFETLVTVPQVYLGMRLVQETQGDSAAVLYTGLVTALAI